jgi:hypothetical protein
MHLHSLSPLRLETELLRHFAVPLDRFARQVFLSVLSS